MLLFSHCFYDNNHKEYSKYVNKKSPNTKTLKNCLNAFWIGGLICTVGQAFNNIYSSFDLNKDEVAAATAITLIFIGALLTGLDVYDSIAKVAGAGTIVPITGFANAIVSPAIEHRSEGYVMGIGGKMFIIAGPVLVYGITASIVLGLIYSMIV